MKPELKREFLSFIKKLEMRPTKPVGTREMRNQLGAFLGSTAAENLLVMDHGTPRAVVLDYDTYNTLIHLARLITLEVMTVDISDPSNARLQEIEEKRKLRLEQLSQSYKEGKRRKNATLANH